MKSCISCRNHSRCFSGHEVIVRPLFDKGADVNTQGGRYDAALQAGSAKGLDSTGRAADGQGADVNANGGD